MTQEPESPTAEEREAQIRRGIASDAENPEWTADDFARARPFEKVFPDLAAEIRRNPGGRPKSPSPKLAVSLRLDRSVIAHFKAGGPGWQTRINAALRKIAEER
jgi:uncharacterized protein (DUF4415 family)